MTAVTEGVHRFVAMAAGKSMVVGALVLTGALVGTVVLGPAGASEPAPTWRFG